MAIGVLSLRVMLISYLLSSFRVIAAQMSYVWLGALRGAISELRADLGFGLLKPSSSNSNTGRDDENFLNSTTLSRCPSITDSGSTSSNAAPGASSLVTEEALIKLYSGS
jgi:hypothetical protein